MSCSKKKIVGQRSRGNFDSVPADDGFRNYMARKIELQRKQFGLVVPPPPPPSPPPTPKPTPPKILKKTKLAKYNKRDGNSDPTPEFSDTISSKNNITRSEKKSVRFHKNLEVGGVSQVLNNLKQRRTCGKKRGIKRRRKSQGLALDSNLESLADNTPNRAHTDPPSVGEERNNSRISYTSILGVLDNLQKRHGISSSKRKRSCVDSDASRKLKGNERVAVQLPSGIESLELVKECGSIASSFTNTLKDVNHGAEDISAPLKRGRESRRCTDKSILKGLEGTIHDCPSRKDEPRNNGSPLTNTSPNPSTNKQQFAEQLQHSDNTSPESNDSVLSQSTHHSSDGEPQSYPTRDPHDLHHWVTSQYLESCIPKSPLKFYPKESSTDTLPFISTPTPKLAQEPSHRSDLFLAGIVVLVNGHTSPDATTLMRLLHKHGGDLEKYETRKVTHIIAEQLSAAKANIYKRQKKPTPVCRPEWITDSVEHGKLLPYGDYLLEDVKDDAGTKSVKSFFNKNEQLVSNEEGNSISRGIRDKRRDEMENESSTIASSSHRWQDSHPSEANYHLSEQVRTVGNDPNFLDSYFSNSRLSYIGSFKQRVKPTRNKAPRSQLKVGAKKFVLLVDMDCFFASVALRKYPQLRSKPVAVGHAHSAKFNASENAISAKTHSKNSSSELSTCNYIAREHGIKKGMFLGDAIQLCPKLVVLPYDFKGFEEVSGIVADQLHGYAEQYNGFVEQVSCDESYVEINLMPGDCSGNDIYRFVNTLAEHIRADIVKKTECTASIGIGPNKFLAKLAADKVKPNACCLVTDWREFLENLNLRDIPGIGRKFQKKLQPHGLCTVNDIWDLGDEAENTLGEIIGSGTAHKIVQYCNGKDERVVTPAIRKSIGAECNYGVRFEGPYGVDYMIQGLSKEVEKRMTGAGVRGAKLTLKVMKSKDPSKVPGKFLGHGLCDNISRSVDVLLTRDKDIISSAANKLFGKLGIDKKEVRGMGIVMGSLNSDGEVDFLNSSPSKLSAWLKKDSTVSISREDQKVFEGAENPNQVTFAIDDNGDLNSDSGSLMMPTFSQLDQDVLHNLPEDILSEVKSMYGKETSHQTQVAGQPSPKSPTRRHAWRVNKSDKTIPIAGQTSVRRMLKLACVKSGEEQLDENHLSLSQLDCLPLEMQLQIANGDDIKIVKRPKQKSMSMDDSHPLTHSKGDPMHSELMPVQNSQNEAQDKGSTDSLSPNFHQENITPLQDFILSNPNPDSDMVETVKDFLFLCVCERRIDDAVIFLRAIKNMHNGWDNKIYLQLRDLTFYEIHSTTGCQLDTRWLGL